MKLEEAKTVVTMLKAATRYGPVQDEELQVWLNQLVALDGHAATQAVLVGMKEWDSFPSWKQFFEVYRSQRQERELGPSSRCPTCEGHKFVFVASRAPKQSLWMKQKGIEPNTNERIEEYAPCPDCNTTVDASFRRGIDGRMVEPMDPAQVRQFMERPRSSDEVSEDIPEWVMVWNFARRIRQPRCMFGFPQQRGEVDEATLMSEDEYEALREEWITAGSPKASVAELFTAAPVSSDQSVIDRAVEVLQEVAEK